VKIAPGSGEDELELNIIPLVDVMLVLLMFFVLTTTFEQHTRLRVSLPESAGEPVAEADDPLIVAIDREGRFYVGENEVLNPRIDTLKEAIVAVTGDTSGAPERRVLLRADARTEHQHVVTAMDALGQLGFSNVGIATVRPAEDSD
jgi:biopolymer transport protein ExbD